MKNRRKLSHSPTTNIRNIRIVILGKDGVGKSALTVRLLTKRYIGEYDATLENTYRHHMDIENAFVALEIVDTAGQNTKKKLDELVPDGDIFIVLYSITDMTSFKEASCIAQYVKKRRTLDSTSLVVAGTKNDLEHFRQVPDIDGSELTHELNCGFYEISISEGFSDTLDMFHDILRQYLESHKGYLESHKGNRDSLIPLVSISPTSPTIQHKEIKSPTSSSSSSSWAKVKGLRTIPFRRKSVQTS